jgi:hypothetical protein
VEWSATLSNPVWADVAGDVLASDAIAGKSFPITAAGQAFYRVVTWQYSES